MMSQPWEWKEKIYTAMIIFFIIGIVLILIAFSMRTVDEYGHVQDNWVAGAVAGLGTGILFGGLGGCYEGISLDLLGAKSLEEIKQEMEQERGKGMIVATSLGVAFGWFVGDFVGGEVGYGIGVFVELFVGVLVGYLVSDWAVNTKIRDVVKEKRIAEEKLKSGEKMYKWLIDRKAIKDGQSISQEVLSTVYEMYTRWEKLKNDKNIDDRISGVKDEMSELKRIKAQYEEMASHDTAAGKAAKKELEKIEQQLSMKNSELEQLKKLKDEQKRSITELEDQAKLYVLTAMAGRVGVTSQEVIEHAEMMIETLKKGLEEIEIPQGEFMGYSVIRKMHHGGFADIYLLKKDEKYYALKVPKDVDILGGNETLLISEEEIEAFEKEGKIWKEISSIDGVVNLIDYSLRPFPWFIMEYMDGGTLKDHIGNTDEKKAVEYIESVLNILSEIHGKGIIHRDIKPENILFDSNVNIKLTDFGLSRVLSSSSSTGAGFKGTLVYSAPEQFDRKTFGGPDNRTDIYQTGAVLYELLTGRPPFTGSTQEIINGIMTKKPERPSSINPNIDEGMDFVVMKALEKRKEDRWQSAVEFKRALEGVNAHL